MRFLVEITSNPHQTYNLKTDEGDNITITLRYCPSQQMWMLNTSYKSLWTLNGIKVVDDINILKQYENIIPYGISCISDDFIDPFLVTDFSTQRCKLFLLNSADILAYKAARKNP